MQVLIHHRQRFYLVRSKSMHHLLKASFSHWTKLKNGVDKNRRAYLFYFYSILQPKAFRCWFEYSARKVSFPIQCCTDSLLLKKHQRNKVDDFKEYRRQSLLASTFHRWTQFHTLKQQTEKRQSVAAAFCRKFFLKRTIKYFHSSLLQG